MMDPFEAWTYSMRQKQTMPTDSVFGDRAENQSEVELDGNRLELDGCTSSFGALSAATSPTSTAV